MIINIQNVFGKTDTFHDSLWLCSIDQQQLKDLSAEKCQSRIKSYRDELPMLKESLKLTICLRPLRTLFNYQVYKYTGTFVNNE